jgi:hypothetical protein
VLPNKTLRKLSCWFCFVKGGLQQDPRYPEDIRRQYDQGHCFVNSPVYHDGSVASSSSSQTVRPYTLFQTPRSAVQSYKDPSSISPIATTRGCELGDPSARYCCPICNTNLYSKKGLNRHMKDKHLPWNVCHFCSIFKWSQGRNYLYEEHLKSCHEAVLWGEQERACNDGAPGCTKS